MQTPALKKSRFDFLVQIVEKRSETNDKRRKHSAKLFLTGSFPRYIDYYYDCS